jgi:hypothetical protein
LVYFLFLEFWLGEDIGTLSAIFLIDEIGGFGYFGIVFISKAGGLG